MSFFRDYELRASNPPYETSIGTTTRSRSSVLSFSSALWIMGGLRAPGLPQQFNDVWKSTDGAATWVRQTDAAWPAANAWMGACVHDGKMWVSGGTAPGASNGVYSSTDGITWTTVRADGAANGFTARDRHAMASYDGKLWVVGGAASVWSSTDGAIWTQTTATPGWDASRVGPACTVYDGKLWMSCGNETSGDKKDVWHTTDGITWTQATSSIHADFTPRYNVTFFSRGGRLYVGHGTGPKDLWTSTDGVTWTREHAQPTLFDAVGGGPTGVLHSDGSVYIFMAASYVDDSTNRHVWRSILAGELVKTAANDTIAASGAPTNPAGTLAKTNANDTLAAAGQTSTSGSLAETNANDTLYGVLYGELSPPPPPGDTVVAVGFADFKINTGSKVPYYYLGEDELLDVKYYRPIYYWESMDPDKFDNLGEDDLDQLDDEVFQMKWENMTKDEFVAWKKRTRGF